MANSGTYRVLIVNESGVKYDGQNYIISALDVAFSDVSTITVKGGSSAANKDKVVARGYMGGKGSFKDDKGESWRAQVGVNITGIK